ncbi:MAG: PAS domain S-box protein [Candidatus Moranbacteria bacterium]|nr:PAS domain S-box protein [Candidatus Moranbacteria bacterium]
MKDIIRKNPSVATTSIGSDGTNVSAADRPPVIVDGFAEEKKKYARELEKQNKALRDTERAVLNILEDTLALQRKAESEAEELKKFQLAVSGSSDTVVIADPDAVILYANDAACRTTGYPMEEIIGNKPSLWGRQMGKGFYETMWRTIKDDKKPFRSEVMNRKKDGGTYIAELSITPLLGDDGEVRFFVGVQHDVTERRRYEDELVTAAKRLEAVNADMLREKERAEGVLRFLRSIGDGVFATDRDGKIVFMNKAAEELSGCPVANAEGVYYGDIFSFSLERNPMAGCVKIVEDAMDENRSGEDGSSRVILGRRDGGQLPVSYTVAPIRDEKGEPIGCVVTLQDASRERQMEQMKNDFLSIAAHQLRTPLTGIRWSLEILLESGTVGEEVAAELRKIHESSCRMSVLIDDLIDASRINQRLLSETPTSVNPGELVLSSIESMRAVAGKRKITITSRMSKDMPEVPLIKEGFVEVMGNLIGNAIKYSKDGGEVHVEAIRRGGVFRVSVSDKGIGIPKSEQGQIFTRFFRATNAMLKEADGSGIGLSAVKSFLDEMGGRIWFESSEGSGTTFFIELPILSEGKKSKKKE